VDAVYAPLLERVDDHLGVGVVGLPGVTAEFLELSANLGVVVDLAVEHEPYGAIFVAHGLIGGR